ncbi:MAG: FkbM family methyltransferase [Gemmatimonadetes bacterium]|nr:FkbM family methyltransferase [Gemmatimonadota bacterium]
MQTIRRPRSPLNEAMPWLSWSCIDWLEPRIRSGMRVLEYGGGGSTIYFLMRGCQVTTVEGNAQWVEDLRAHTKLFGESTELRFVDSQANDPRLAQEYAAQARIGRPWDVILVDGAFRGECVAVARECVVPGGMIIVDNTDLPEYAGVRAEQVLHEFDRNVFRGLGYARVMPTTTEVFIAKSGANDSRAGRIQSA